MIFDSLAFFYDEQVREQQYFYVHCKVYLNDYLVWYFRLRDHQPNMGWKLNAGDKIGGFLTHNHCYVIKCLVTAGGFVPYQIIYNTSEGKSEDIFLG